MSLMSLRIGAISGNVFRETPSLLSPSLDDWLPADQLARLVVDIVAQLDLSPLARQYRGAGSAAYHPSVLLGLLKGG